ncbi:MAG: DUF4421 domain-containing protein [Bacteroides sp.]|nr:DUF4421 domain-containing protein [Bacteroides sp.]MCM1379387.1 DUF4421 domain-containing protein [Bacteroides sp.]MCM1445247.1 DUF4421 domain-containing protein [Prevotella sp.]
MKRFIFILSLLFCISVSVAAQEVDFEVELDDEHPKASSDTLPLPGNWAQQLWRSGFNINDPRIHYPRFMNFCCKVYNWADETFNRYDTAYVVGTGKNWKFIIDSTNEMQRYGYLFDIQSPDKADLVSIRSNLGYDLGARLSFMAVSIGYTWNINELIGRNNSPRSTFNFQFTCARFSAEITQQSIHGGTYIDRFAKYSEGRRIHLPLDNTSNEQLMINAYYFFNFRKYSQAAAYSYSKYQKRSAGSWLVGVRYISQYLMMDFTDLPADVLSYKPEQLPLLNKYKFHDICVQGGYAHNFALPHNWLINFTILPGMGFRRSLIKDKPSASEMVAVNLDGRVSLVYNHRAFFANLQGRATGIFLFNSGYSFLMASEFFTLKAGVRF